MNNSVIKNPHFSVMCREIVEQMNVSNGGVYVDCTFGSGGHSAAILNANKSARVVAIDRDICTKEYLNDFPKELLPRLLFVNGLFSNVSSIVTSLGFDYVDSILYDVGLSSMQIDKPEMGFSFMNDGPLKMQMGKNAISAFDVVNGYAESELADIIFYYGEEKKARQIAKAIVSKRNQSPIMSTLELSRIIGTVVFRGRSKIHHATKTFQAIRIEVNNELEELGVGLESGFSVLKREGRMCVVTFHSLEDRIVKKFITNHTRDRIIDQFDSGNPLTWEQPKKSEFIPEMRIITKKPLIATSSECKINARSRSAKLRIVEKI